MTIQCKPLICGIGCVASIVAIAAFYFGSHNGNEIPYRSARRTAELHVTPSQKQTDVNRNASSAGGSPKGMSASTDYRQRFAKANNYWKFAHEILPAAKMNDPDAQFYLSRVLEGCAQDNKMYFEHKGEKLALDQGLQYASRRHLSVDTAQSVFDRCHEFQENDSTALGVAEDWLAKATQAGQPLAEATTASKMLMRELQENLAKAGGVANPNPVSPIGNGVDPRELLRAAVESRDPEVLFSIGEVQEMLDPTNTDASSTRLAWWLVACQRGLDCSSNADWVKKSCGDDPQCASADSSGDLVRTLAGDKWPSVQQRASDISNKLNAGQWGELGIGS